jgi:diaminopimelate decarboxylase
MSTASRTADPTGAARPMSAATGAVAVDHPLAGRTEARRSGAPLVVLDLPRVVQRFRELRAALPWADVRYDVSALAHPALLRSIAADGAGFAVSHDAALRALTRCGADPGRVLSAASGARARRAAWDAGVRHFIVEDWRGLDGFAAAPYGTGVLLRLDPEGAVPAAWHASGLGVHVAGLSLTVGSDATVSDVVTAVQDAVEAGAAIAAATGRRIGMLDLGGAFAGRLGATPALRDALARSIRSIVAPATSRTAIVVSAGDAVAADSITVVEGATQRYVDAATASAYIDAGAEVRVLHDGTDRAGRHRILRPSRARSTWSPAG